VDKVNEITTKARILKTAARLYAEKGYDKVTTREIAQNIGINSASIYYYFPSKEDILKNLYQVYAEHRRQGYPDVDELLRLAETEPPHEVLMRSEYHFNEEIREMLDQILVTAARRIVADPESERFIQENIFDSIQNVLKPLLERMVELKRIQPFDIAAFINILSYYCFSAAALNNSIFGQGVAEYQAGMYFIYSWIVPVAEETE